MPAAPPTYLATTRRSLLYGVIAGVPLLFLTSTYEAFSTPKFSLLVMAVSAAIGVRLAEYVLGTRELSGLRRLAVPAGAVAVPLTIGWLVSPFKGLGFIGEMGRHQGLLSYLLFIAAGALIYEAFKDDPWKLARLFVFVGTGVAVYALIQKAGMDPIEWANYASGSTVGNPNFVGGFLAMTLAPSLYLLVTEKERLPWAATSLLTAGGIIVVGTIGGWVAALGGAAVVLSWRYGRSEKQKLAGVVVAGLLALGSVVSVAATIVDVGLPVPDEQAVEIRGQWWEAGLSMAVSSPVAGRGPAGFAVEGVQFRPEVDALRRGYTFSDDPHSVFIWYLASAGILGGAGFLILIVWILKTGLSPYRTESSPVAIAFFAAAVAYISQALVSIDELTLRAGLWIALAGLAAGVDLPTASRAGKPPTARARRSRRRKAQTVPAGAAAVAFLCFAVPAGAGLYYGSTWLRGDLAISRGSVQSSAGNFDVARSELQDGVDLLGHYQARFLYGTLLGHLVEVDPSDEVEVALDETFSYLEDVPHIMGMSTYAKALAAAGREDEALDLLERAAALDPLNPDISAERGTILIAMGQADEAIALLEPLEVKAGPRTHSLNSALEVLEAARAAGS